MRASYLRRVLAERLTGIPIETYRNGHMDRGQAQEADARAAYEAETGELATKVGFIQHAALMAGCSPDSFIGADGAIEIKSVIPTVQIDTLLRGNIPPEHRAQCMGVLWISGRQWIDFVSWSPDMPAHLRLCIYRVTPDAEYIAMLDKEVRTFLSEVDRLEAQLMNREPLLAQLIASIRSDDPATQP